MLAGLVDLKHLRTRSFVQVEAHLTPRCQTGSTHRGALQKLVAAADRGRDQTRPGGELVPGDHLLLEAEDRPVVDTLHEGCDAQPEPHHQHNWYVVLRSGGELMIKNERQYKITRSRADDVRNTIGELQRTPLPDGLQPEMRELQLDALRGTLGDLEVELAEYDALHDATLIEATGIEQLPTALIRARIACGLTQRQLAERVGLQEQAIQRYEATDYAGVSFARLVEIAEALELTIHYAVRLNQAG